MNFELKGWLPAGTPFIVFGLVALQAASLHGQTSESNDVVHLTRSDLGQFEPANRPDLSQVEAEIVERTNAFRGEHDRGPVTRDEALDQTAQDFAAYMAETDRYGHTADGRQAGERARAHDYPLCLIAENIAYFFHTTGFKTNQLARKAVTGWEESPPHRKNILRPHVTEIGVGVAQSEATGVYYLVQLFGRPRSQAITFDITNEVDKSIRYSLGDREFELPSRYTRTHELCIPTELQLTQEAETEPLKTTPSTGEHLFVTSSAEGLNLNTQNEQ
ncbi:MAG: CAP domain-containing protein [Pirellulales bacterium]